MHMGSESFPAVLSSDPAPPPPHDAGVNFSITPTSQHDDGTEYFGFQNF